MCNWFKLQLPGVDPNDPSVQDVLASLQAEEVIEYPLFSFCRILTHSGFNISEIQCVHLALYCIQMSPLTFCLHGWFGLQEKNEDQAAKGPGK